MRKEKMIKFTCKKCDFTEMRPYINYGRVPSKAETFGRSMQEVGSQMSVFSGGHKKGGHAMNAQTARDRRVALQERKVCPNCMSQKTQLLIVKV